MDLFTLAFLPLPIFIALLFGGVQRLAILSRHPLPRWIDA